MCPEIIGVGMACLDVILRMHDLPTWENGTRLDAMGIEGGGPCATALCASARLGASTGFIGTYGIDRMAKIKLQTLQEFGVDTSHAFERAIPENQVVFVMVNAANGERVFSGTGRWSDHPVLAEEIERDYITSAQILHLDGYHPKAALQAAQWMHAQGKTVMLDGSATNGPISAEMRVLVENCDVLICGSGFGPALTGLEDVWEAGEAILTMGPRCVVQTEGKAGSFTVTASERFHQPSFEVDVIDTTGAGDVFHGAYLIGLLKGWDARTTAIFSTAVSAIKCTHLGGRGGIPTFDEVLQFLNRRDIALQAS